LPNLIAEVAVNAALDVAYDYLAPDELGIAVGDAVIVPLRSRAVKGVVLSMTELSDTPLARLKPVTARIGPIDSALLHMAHFIHSYYQAPLGMSYALVLPPEPKRLLKRKNTPAPKAAVAPTFALSKAQQTVIDTVAASLGRFQAFLLHGVTGSGKTEVALECARAAIEAGKQALMLVPEINLTPQWVERIQSRLPDTTIAVLHSRLSDGERYAAYAAAASGQAQLILGTRLAIFTPLPQLGLIVIDEEHDSAYKQAETPRYHARDLAVLRAQKACVPLLLASATPSFESVNNANKGRYQKLSLAARATAAPLPRIVLTPAKGKSQVEGVAPLLFTAMCERLARGEQTLLFLNRRGFAPRLVCPHCQWQSDCPHCDAPMIFHRVGQHLLCHRCGQRDKIPTTCPSCAETDLLPLGMGTQKIDQSLRLALPQARIARVDLDSTRNKNAWPLLREQIMSKQVDIIIGTQMVAKGHDFPDLSLVGVIGADDALYSIDFRASERLFALLTQVAGRAGRAAISGEVMIQTDFPNHAVYQALLHDSSAEFVAATLAERSQQGWPPDFHLALIRAESNVPNAAQQCLRGLHQDLEASLSAQTDCVAYPPVPSPLARIAGHWRWQMLLSSNQRGVLKQFLAQAKEKLSQNTERSLRWTIDVDPIDLM
jgi:primosomal protein N' (replication factor Y) (superfamily II helicase)